MRRFGRAGRINLRFLAILVTAVFVLAGGAAVGYKIRSRVIANRAKAAGIAALEKQEWAEAAKQLKQYLSRHPEDPDMLRKYAEANLSIVPLESAHLAAAAAAYRMLFRKYNDVASGRELVRLYQTLRNFSEAAYICKLRLDRDGQDTNAKLERARSLIEQIKFVDAKQDLVELVNVQAPEPEAYVLLARVLDEEGDAQADAAVCALLGADPQAERQPASAVVGPVLDLGIQRNPNSALLLAVRAGYRQSLADKAKEPAVALEHKHAAKSDLEAADQLCQAHPPDVDTRLALIGEWLLQGDADRAEVHLRALSEFKPKQLREQGIYIEAEFKLRKLSCQAEILLKRQKKEQKADAVKLADDARHELPDPQYIRFVEGAVKLYLFGEQPQKALEVVQHVRAILKDKSVENGTFDNLLSLLEAQVANSKNEPFTVINLLEPLLLRHPDKAIASRAQELLTRAYLQTGQPERALATGENLAESLSDSPEAGTALQMQLLSTCLTQGRQQEARQIAERLKATAPRSPELDLLLLKAERLTATDVTREQLAEWSKRLDQCAAARPRSAEVRRLQAALDFDGGNLDAAISRLEKAIQECDDTNQLSLVLARLYAANKGDTAKAIEICTAAVQKYPKLAAPRLNLAGCQLATGQRAAAKTTLEQAFQELTGNEKNLVADGLASLLAIEGDSAGALNLLEQEAARRPDDVGLLVRLVNQPGMQARPADRQKVIDHLHQLQGEHGVNWRLEQAKADLQLIGGAIQASAKSLKTIEGKVVGLLRYCIDANPRWSEPVQILGKMYELEGKPDLAEDAYRRLVEAVPGEPMVTSRLLTLLQRTGRNDEARELLRRIPSQSLAAVDPLGRQQVDIALAMNDLSQAASTLDRALSAQPQDVQSKILRARLLVAQKGDLDRALRLLDEAEALVPTPATLPAEAEPGSGAGVLANILAARVEVLHARGQDQEAAAALDRAVEQRKDLLSYLLRAMFREMLGSLDTAEQDFVALTKLPTQEPRGYEQLGKFYARQGALPKAMAAWEAGLKVAPDDQLLTLLLAETLLGEPEGPGRERGLALLKAALAREAEDPNPVLLTMLAKASDAADITKRAVAAWEKILQVDTHNLRAHGNLIELADRTGNREETRRRFQAAIGANPQNVTLLLDAARLEERYGSLVGMAEYAGRVLKLRPDSPDALHVLVRVALAAGDLGTADAENEKVRKLTPDDELARLEQAEILRKRDRTAEAIACLEAFWATPNGKQSLGTLLTLADLCIDKQDFDRAATWIQEAEQLAPGHLAVLRARLSWLAAQGKSAELSALVDERAKAASPREGVFLVAGAALSRTKNEANLRMAIGYLRQAVELAPDKDASPHMTLAGVAAAAKEFDLAEASMRKAKERLPNDINLLNSLAWTIGIELNRPEEALPFAEQALAIEPDDPHLLDTRGAILLKQCTPIDAELEARKAQLGSLDDDKSKALQARAQALREAARKDLERCLALPLVPTGTKLGALKRLKEVLVKLEQVDTARAKIQQALRADQEHPVFAPGERAELEALLNDLN